MAKGLITLFAKAQLLELWRCSWGPEDMYESLTITTQGRREN